MGRHRYLKGSAHGVKTGRFGEGLYFFVPLTSKNAFGFEISGSENTGPYSRAPYLRGRGVPYRPYEKTCPRFQTRSPFSK